MSETWKVQLIVNYGSVRSRCIVLDNLMDSSPGSTRSEMMPTSRTGTLFDSLSTDALSIIVKEVSNLLVNENVGSDESSFGSFYNRVKIPYLTMLFSEKSPFRSAASTLVSEIELNWRLETALKVPDMEFRIGRDMLEGSAEELELGRKIISACGPYVRKVCVRGVPEEGANKFVEQFKSHVFQYCPNVEESFFRKYAANLRAMDWDGAEDEKGVSSLPECTKLKRLISQKMSTGMLVALLKGCGSTLEELDISITPVEDSAEVMEAIANYCKQLSVLLIENVEEVMDVIGKGRYSSLICSYGSRLKKAKTDRLSQEYLVEVVKECTSLEIAIGWHWNDEEVVDWQYVYDLGPRIMELNFRTNSWHENETRRALRQCSNIRKLSIHIGYSNESRAITDAIIVNTFSPSCFPKLEHLTLNNFRAHEKNMALIASCTSNLKTAVFMPFEEHGEVSDFQIIADTNPHLNEICIMNSISLESLSKLVKMFCNCRKLWFGRYSSNESEVVYSSS